jgi:hypothetical protein
MLVILSVFLLLLGLALLEARLHERRLRQIPIRIHVNGTRGKSTTTRLIAAGLRAGGHRVIAKTTGTLPQIILEDGSEIPVRRRGRATIREQMTTIALAARRRADVVVLECMAIHPELQWVSERRMVRATVGVMTNVRLDHMEVMGQTREAVARASWSREAGITWSSSPRHARATGACSGWLPILMRGTPWQSRRPWSFPRTPRRPWRCAKRWGSNGSALYEACAAPSRMWGLSVSTGRVPTGSRSLSSTHSRSTTWTLFN